MKEELAQYKKALGDKFKTPALFDIREDYLLTKEYEYAGYTNFESKIVIKPEALVTDQREGRYLAIRHELAHMQDSKVGKDQHRKIRSYADESELIAGGIKKNHSGYYFKNEIEAKAVFAECDMNAVSDAFKRKMTEEIKGLPKEIVNLQDVSRPKVALLSKFYGKKNEKVIEELEKLLGGNISKEVAGDIIDKPNYFWVIKKILKKQPNGTIMSQNEFLQTFKEAIVQYNKKFHDNNFLEYIGFSLKRRKLDFDGVELGQFMSEGNYQALKNFKQTLVDSSNIEGIKKVETSGIFS